MINAIDNLKLELEHTFNNISCFSLNEMKKGHCDI